MDLYALTMIQATNAARGEATSALPNAPVVPDRRDRAAHTRTLTTTRRLTAALLTRAARAVEPKATPECHPAR